MSPRAQCDCPIYCRFCGARLRRDYVGHKCPTHNCQWQHGAGDGDGCMSGHSGKEEATVSDDYSLRSEILRASKNLCAGLAEPSKDEDLVRLGKLARSMRSTNKILLDALKHESEKEAPDGKS